jgi:prepilin-type processing-associated H-X9-DG protein
MWGNEDSSNETRKAAHFKMRFAFHAYQNSLKKYGIFTTLSKDVPAISLKMITKPSDMMEFTENGNNPSLWFRQDFRNVKLGHGHVLNIVFVDGHVDSFTYPWFYEGYDMYANRSLPDNSSLIPTKNFLW